MVPAVESVAVEELSFCEVLYLALMKCSMEHVRAAMGAMLEGGRNLSQRGAGLKTEQQIY